MNIDYQKVGRVLKHVFSTAVEGDADSVLNVIEKYFYEKEMVMILGDVKSSVLTKIIKEHQPKTLAELGGYFGYSSIFMAKQIQHIPGAHVYSVEFDPVLACVMEKMIRYAGLQDKITVINGDLQSALPILKQHGVNNLDLFFLDHIKEAYVSDFQLAEQNNLFHKDTVIVADNIFMPGAPEYLKFMQDSDKYDLELNKFSIDVDGKSFEDAVMVSTLKAN